MRQRINRRKYIDLGRGYHVEVMDIIDARLE